MDTVIATPHENRASVIIIGLVSLAMILFGAFSFVRSESMKKHCTSIGYGTVLNNESTSDRVGNYYKWTVSFITENGSEYTFKTGKTLVKAREGNSCAVLYDPEKPERAFATEVPPDSGFARVCVGILFAVIGYTVLFFKKRSRRLPDQ